MQKLSKFIGVGSAFAGSALLAVSAFATTTPITMDSGVSDELSNLLTSLKTVLLSNFGNVVLVGGGVLVSIIVTFAAIKWFRGMIHH